MKTALSTAGIAIILIVGLVFLVASAYTVHETEQAIITQFGKPVGGAVKDAGLHFKLPFIQDVNTIEKRILEWDGLATKMATKDKTFIMVDTFARWRISDPLQYFLLLREESRALPRLNSILGSATRNAIASHNLTEVIRTTKDREPEVDEFLSETSSTAGGLARIRRGRALLEKDIMERAKPKLAELGIELLDIRFKRINYEPSVQDKIFTRMISERQQIAERFRSEGAGEAARIIGNKERDLKKIESEAYKEVQEIEGAADARATEIYATAYNQSPEAAELYEFLKTMETYRDILGKDSTLILSTDSELFKFLKSANPGASAAASAPSNMTPRKRVVVPAPNSQPPIPTKPKPKPQAELTPK